MRSLSGSSHRMPIPDLQVAEGELLSTDVAKAEALNEFFARQTHLDGSDGVPDVSELSHNDEELTLLNTTPADVFAILSRLPRRKAPGLDGITTYLLRECARSIASSLATLFNCSFHEQYFPRAWKDAVVVPVYKRGDRALLTNYRPISLLSAVGKVCERVVYDKLYQFLSPVLSTHQSGLRKHDGTSFQLLRLVQQWSEALDESQYVGIVFFDLRKAFDRVWHAGLIAKLKAAGLRGAALAWFSSYLVGRQQRTRLGSAVSSPCALSAGVPQGAILSPLLFILHVNDIGPVTDASVNLFANDTSSFQTD